jgi:hypothetical protein
MFHLHTSKDQSSHDSHEFHMYCKSRAYQLQNAITLHCSAGNDQAGDKTEQKLLLYTDCPRVTWLLGSLFNHYFGR